MTNLAGRLPKDHGLSVLQSQLVDSPQTKHIVLAVVDCRKVTSDMDSGEIEPTARILRIEAVLRQDYDQAERLLRRSLEQRHGQPVLPFDTENELKELFAELHIEDEGRPDV